MKKTEIYLASKDVFLIRSFAVICTACYVFGFKTLWSDVITAKILLLVGLPCVPLFFASAILSNRKKLIVENDKIIFSLPRLKQLFSPSIPNKEEAIKYDDIKVIYFCRENGGTFRLILKEQTKFPVRSFTAGSNNKELFHAVYEQAKGKVSKIIADDKTKKIYKLPSEIETS